MSSGTTVKQSIFLRSVYLTIAESFDLIFIFLPKAKEKGYEYAFDLRRLAPLEACKKGYDHRRHWRKNIPHCDQEMTQEATRSNPKVLSPSSLATLAR